MRSRSLRSRPGFTLIELLVVIAIIGILIALLVPAVQRVREAAARTQCVNNLKQLAVACHSYHDVYNRIPPGAVGKSGGENQGGNWLVIILPFMEQAQLAQAVSGCPAAGGYNAGTVGAAAAAGILPAKLPYLRCPSDSWEYANTRVTNYVGSVGPQCVPGACGYEPFQKYCDPITQLGQDWGYSASPAYGYVNDIGRIRGMFGPYWTSAITLPKVTDGTSSTIMLGECLPSTNGWARQAYTQAGPLAGWGGDAVTQMRFTIIPINYPIDESLPDCSSSPLIDPTHNPFNYNVYWGFKSRHTGGANFAFADGSVHFLSESIDHKTYQLLGCRNDGMTTGWTP
jgi:prepilin-type N-terminal cleavage/methylation domain-containing protein/prepilin-type processing-associated H-X9-DG protein